MFLGRMCAPRSTATLTFVQPFFSFWNSGRLFSLWEREWNSNIGSRDAAKKDGTFKQNIFFFSILSGMTAVGITFTLYLSSGIRCMRSQIESILQKLACFSWDVLLKWTCIEVPQHTAEHTVNVFISFHSKSTNLGQGNEVLLGSFCSAQ